MPVIWDFRCYVTARGVDEVRAWFDLQPMRVRMKFSSRLRILAQQQPAEWRPPLFRWLRSPECKGVGEVRFEVGGVQYRPLGFSSGGNVFTVALCATERGDQLVPREACAIVLRRKAEIKNDSRHSQPLWLALE